MLKLVQGWLHMEHHAARAKFKKVHFETKNRKSEGSCAITPKYKVERKCVTWWQGHLEDGSAVEEFAAEFEARTTEAEVDAA